MAQERQKKTSLTQLVHSTIGLSLVTQEGEAPLAEVGNPEESMASRLQFNSKSGAGSVSSDKVALTETDDASNLDRGRRQRPTKTLINQASQDGSVFDDSPSPEHLLRHLEPRPATLSREGTRLGSDTDLMGIQEALKFADKTATTTSSSGAAISALRDRSMSLQPSNSKIATQPITWEEDTSSNHHIWHEVDTREACYFAETQTCQQFKLFHSKRIKVRCSACKVLVHTTCLQQLSDERVHCKETFREIKQKVRDTVVLHHFLKRRKPVGTSKCVKCERGFGNWKIVSGREVVAVSCSWCGDAYHPSCFSHRFKSEPCHMGPLRHLLIPPSWIIRVPMIERATSVGDETPKAFSTTRRKSRKSKRKKLDDRPSKFFRVKGLSPQQYKPLVVFINPKSGGNQGARLMQTFQWLLNPRQVFDLSLGGPMFGLKMFRDLSNLRILACGGDGTVGWVLSILDELNIKPSPPVAVLPLGTGNDLSRVLGWGSGYSDEPLDKILMHVEEGPVVELDRWQLNVWPNPQAPPQTSDTDGVEDVPLHVVNNYFSIGSDAQVSLEFHLGREANPEKFNNRIKNKFYYTKLGGKDLLQRKFTDLTDHLTLYGDGEDLTAHIRSLRLEAICFLNIPSYGAGTNAWGTPSSRDPKFTAQTTDDGVIEVVGFWSSSYPKLQMGVAHGERIAQCQNIKMVTDKTLPVQIDGEPCKLKPAVIILDIKNRASMVRKVSRRYSEAPLRGVAPTERIKLSVSKVTRDQYDRMHSDIQELRRAATPLGLIMSSVGDTLRTVRIQVESFTTEDQYGARLLCPGWRFLDTARSGRTERMFQVLPDQEGNMSVGDMPSDGIIVVELDSSCLMDAPVPKLLSPEEIMPPMVAPCGPNGRRGVERNNSYRMATREDSCLLTIPTLGSVSETTGDTSTAQHRQSIDSSLSEDGYEGDSEKYSRHSPSPSPLHVLDPGSDSTGGETDAGGVPSSVQKALVDAVKRGNVKKVQHYHEKGAVLTATDSNGWSPLHHAARFGKYEVVEYLVAHLPKEALDLVEEEKLQTPLHKAAWYGYINVCKLLVENGASLFRQDYQGNTPYNQALRVRDEELQKYLKRKEAEQKALEEEEMAI